MKSLKTFIFEKKEDDSWKISYAIMVNGDKTIDVQGDTATVTLERFDSHEIANVIIDYSGIPRNVKNIFLTGHSEIYVAVGNVSSNKVRNISISVDKSCKRSKLVTCSDQTLANGKFEGFRMLHIFDVPFKEVVDTQEIPKGKDTYQPFIEEVADYIGHTDKMSIVKYNERRLKDIISKNVVFDSMLDTFIMFGPYEVGPGGKRITVDFTGGHGYVDEVQKECSALRNITVTKSPDYLH